MISTQPQKVWQHKKRSCILNECEKSKEDASAALRNSTYDSDELGADALTIMSKYWGEDEPS